MVESSAHNIDEAICPSFVLESSAVRVGVASGAAAHARHAGPDSRAGTGRDGRVGAQHADPRAELGTAERDHVLADMGSNNVAVLRAGMSQDVLNQVVAVLVAGDVDEGNSRSVSTALADTIKVAT